MSGKSLFPLGRIVSTPGALEALGATTCTPLNLLTRHVVGDWGELGDEDKRSNNQAVKDNERILSAYMVGTDTKIWIITEADRSSTTLLLPEEY